MKPSTIGILEREHAKQDHERFGQFFMNRYISGHWPELFNESDHSKAREMIVGWLIDHQYMFDMPPTSRSWDSNVCYHKATAPIRGNKC